jgi:hypothetical protein
VIPFYYGSGSGFGSGSVNIYGSGSAKIPNSITVPVSSKISALAKFDLYVNNHKQTKLTI